MDTQVASAKMEKIARPIQRPVSAAVAPVKVSFPAPVMVAVDKVERGVTHEIEAPEGTPGVQPTLMEKSGGEELIPTDPWETSPMFHELAQFFNVDPKMYNAMKDKISVITDWAVIKAGSNKIEDIFHAVRALEDNLYKPQWDETRLDTLYKYLRLAAHKDAADRALKAFERGPMPDEKVYKRS